MQTIDILFIAANARSLIANRGALIEELLGRGLRIGALVPANDYIDDIDALNIPIWTYNLERHSINPLKELLAFFRIWRQLSSIKPNSVFAYSIKPILFGVIAARIAGVKNAYTLVTGLGYLYTNTGPTIWFLRQVSRKLYGLASALSTAFFLQNPDDKKELEKEWLFRTFANSIIVNGSGVDLDAYPFSEPPYTTMVFACVARLLEEKGIREYVEAATSIKSEYPSVSFWLLGELDETLKNSISLDELEHWRAQGVVDIFGKVDNVAEYLKNTSVFVLPSYYREGTPRAILEAMSVGRPIITCDTPGCRETVKNNINGYLVPPQDVNALRDRMLHFIEQPALIKTMGTASRRIAVNKYDVKLVNKSMINNMIF